MELKLMGRAISAVGAGMVLIFITKCHLPRPVPDTLGIVGPMGYRNGLTKATSEVMALANTMGIYQRPTLVTFWRRTRLLDYAVTFFRHEGGLHIQGQK